MKNLIGIIFLFHTTTIIIAQTKKTCDSILVVYNHTWDNQLFKSRTNKKTLNNLCKCILNGRLSLDENENFVQNVAYLKSALEGKKLRQKATLLSIKMHEKLNPALKNINEQGLLSSITPSDINFGGPRYLKKIKKDFGLNIYLKLLQILNRKLKAKDKTLLIEAFKKNENNGKPEWRTEKWSAAIVLAKNGELIFENYLIQVTKEVTAQERKRYLIYDLGRDLVLTKNRNIINFIIDNFLMSNYSWSDLDTSYSDYFAAFDLLGIVVDEPVFDESLRMKNGREFLRQWFKDHRETYKIKP